MNEELAKVARQAIEQSQKENLDGSDAFWMAVGAVNAEARKRGVISEDELSPEMNAASQAVVKEVKKRG